MNQGKPTAKGAENRYMLASIIGKRAIQLATGRKMLIDSRSGNSVTIAIGEYKANKLCYVEVPTITLKIRRLHD